MVVLTAWSARSKEGTYVEETDQDYLRAIPDYSPASPSRRDQALAAIAVSAGAVAVAVKNVHGLLATSRTDELHGAPKSGKFKSKFHRMLSGRAFDHADALGKVVVARH